MPRRTVFLVIILGMLWTSCAAPTPRRAVPLGLEPPVLSPPGELSATQRLAWWQDQLPRLSTEDRSEARLLMGELELELHHPDAARLAFYEAKGGPLSASELARAERGIGLSYFLEGNVPAGVAHLEKALPNLEQPAAAETSYLLAAAHGEAVQASEAVGQRMATYLQSAHLDQPSAKEQELDLSAIHIDLHRADWGAAPMRSNWDRMTTPYRITVHHTAEPLFGTSVGATAADVRHHQQQHMNARGFADIGYHFLIDRAGRVVEGRPLYAQGAHAKGKNNIGNIGICLLGNFVPQPDRGPEYRRAQVPTPLQMQALDRLVAELRAVYHISAKEVWGHQEVKAETECPGPQLLAWARRYRASTPSQ